VRQSYSGPAIIRFVNVSPASIETGVEATLAAARPWRAKRNDVLGAMKMKGEPSG
jgi:hypothetical protein